MGIATESAVEEAYRPLYVLRFAVWGLLSLLAVSAVVIYVFLVVVQRLSGRRARPRCKRRNWGSMRWAKKSEAAPTEWFITRNMRCCGVPLR